MTCSPLVDEQVGVGNDIRTLKVSAPGSPYAEM